jgi:hypothetical protein
MPRKETRPSQPHRGLTTFEERTTATLEAQDRLLERVEQKLQAPVLNGGFEDLTKKVEKIESIQGAMAASAVGVEKKVGEIHERIYDPEKGLYVAVKHHGDWINTVSKALKWILALMLTLSLGGAGKMIYDFAGGHIHFTP